MTTVMACVTLLRMSSAARPPAEKDCMYCSSRSESVFCHLHDASLKLLDTEKISQRYQSGQFLFYEGNSPSGIYCLSAGAVKLESNSEKGHTHLLRIYTAGEVLGYRSFFAGESYQASALAIKDTEVCFIPKHALDRLLAHDPAISLQFLKILAHEMGELEVRFFHSTDLTAVERVAEGLLYLKDHFGDSLRFSRKEIAEWAGTTPETVMRTLSQFEKDGLVTLTGRKIEIKDRKKLLKLSRILA